MHLEIVGLFGALFILAIGLFFIARMILRLIKVRRTFQSIENKNNMRCPTCQYSLEKNVSGICPECGTPTVMARD